jgi:hypothetical protein
MEKIDELISKKKLPKSALAEVKRSMHWLKKKSRMRR